MLSGRLQQQLSVSTIEEVLLLSPAYGSADPPLRPGLSGSPMDWSNSLAQQKSIPTKEKRVIFQHVRVLTNEVGKVLLAAAQVSQNPAHLLVNCSTTWRPICWLPQLETEYRARWMTAVSSREICMLLKTSYHLRSPPPSTCAGHHVLISYLGAGTPLT